MKFEILASEKDAAAMNIAEELGKLNVKVNYIKGESIYAENIDREIDADFLIFVSKHQAEKEIKSLTVHVPGNFKEAKLGGLPEKLCPASAFFLKHIFKILNKKAVNSGYDVSLEVTHHGPYLEKPCCFIEIGSTDKEWNDKKAARIIAETVREAIGIFKPDSKLIPCTLVGGGHYNQAANKIMLRTNYSIGHICPKYILPITKEILSQMLDKTIPKPEIVFLDWKGLGKYKQNIIDLLEKLNIKYERVQSILKSS